MARARRRPALQRLAPAEAAARLGYSAASYRSTLSRALAALRVLLGVVVTDLPA